MRVIKLVIYDGNEAWVKETLRKSIQGTLYVTKDNIIQTVVLEQAQDQNQTKQFICQGCADKLPWESAVLLDRLIVCPKCFTDLKTEILQRG